MSTTEGTAPAREARPVSTLGGKYLTFQLSAETYGLEILKVQEIIGLMKVTHVPRTPSFVRGVINLRGKVIPVIDLRQKFGIPSREDTEKTCIIVVQVLRAERQLVIMGIIVDEVSEVLDITCNQIEPAPEFGAAVHTAFIMGMGKVGQKVVIMLDIDKVLSGNEVAAVEHAAKA
ncbi:MAG TPA: chemotaxis protein CheW [Planctomycetota bacterium]|nr:chemotaxis protein CheW [Planctomycetota bacterium]